MNKTLAILKLASKFGNKKDVRQFVNHVQVNNNTIAATDGHIAIRITYDYLDQLPSQLTIESIENAAKVNVNGLLCMPEHEVHFPSIDKVFRPQERHTIESATFDVKYILKIAHALEAFRKDLKLPKARLTINPLSGDSANLMGMLVDDMRIEIVLMPLKGVEA